MTLSVTHTTHRVPNCMVYVIYAKLELGICLVEALPQNLLWETE